MSSHIINARATATRNTLQLERPRAGDQHVIQSAEGMTLALGFTPDEATLSQDGQNLSFSFADGSQIVLADFFAHYQDAKAPSFSLDGQELPGEAFLAAFQSDLVPAAGPAAGGGAGSGGAGEYLSDAGTLIGSVDRMGTLAPAAFAQQQPTQTLADTGATTATPATPLPPLSITATATPTAALVAETSLPVGETVALGTFAVSGGTGVGTTLTFGADAQATLNALNLTSGGHTVTFAPNAAGTQLVGSYTDGTGTHTVLSLTITPGAAGQYNVTGTLAAPLDHSGTPLQLPGLALSATDAGGNSATFSTGSLGISDAGVVFSANADTTHTMLEGHHVEMENPREFVSTLHAEVGTASAVDGLHSIELPASTLAQLNSMGITTSYGHALSFTAHAFDPTTGTFVITGTIPQDLRTPGQPATMTLTVSMDKAGKILLDVESTRSLMHRDGDPINLEGLKLTITDHDGSATTITLPKVSITDTGIATGEWDHDLTLREAPDAGYATSTMAIAAFDPIAKVEAAGGWEDAKAELQSLFGGTFELTNGPTGKAFGLTNGEVFLSVEILTQGTGEKLLTQLFLPNRPASFNNADGILEGLTVKLTDADGSEKVVALPKATVVDAFSPFVGGCLAVSENTLETKGTADVIWTAGEAATDEPLFAGIAPVSFTWNKPTTPLTSQGHVIQWETGAMDGKPTLTGYWEDTDHVHHNVIRLTLADKSTGLVTTELMGGIDHNADGHTASNISISVSATVTDSIGQQSTGEIIVGIADSGVTAGSGTGTITAAHVNTFDALHQVIADIKAGDAADNGEIRISGVSYDGITSAAVSSGWAGVLSSGDSNVNFNKEIHFSSTKGGSEGLVFDLHGKLAQSVTATLKDFYGNEGERATVEFYRAGQLVGSKTIAAPPGSNNAELTFSPGANVAFDKAIFKAASWTQNGGQDRNGDNSDFYVERFSFTPAPASISGQVAVTFGADGPATGGGVTLLDGSGIHTYYTTDYQPDAASHAIGTTASSITNPLSFTLSDGGRTLTGTVAGKLACVLTMDGTGHWNYTQHDAMSLSTGNGGGSIAGFQFEYQVTDADGSTAHNAIFINTHEAIVTHMAPGTAYSGADHAEHVYGTASNDSIITAGIHTTAFGGDGNDTMTVADASGSNARWITASHTLHGDGGNDTLLASSGTGHKLFGDAGNDAITARGGTAQTLSGGDGNDTLTASNGTGHVLSGGAGNDIFVVKQDAFASLLGGDGTDTLKLDDSATTLDLTNLAKGALSSIEKIALSGGNSATLTLNAQDVLDMGRDAMDHTLRINGDAGDKVVLQGLGNGASRMLDGVAYNDYTVHDAANHLDVHVLVQQNLVTTTGSN